MRCFVTFWHLISQKSEIFASFSSRRSLCCKIRNTSINWDLLGGEGLSRGNFFKGKFAYGQSAFGRKSGKTVNFCRKNYVNRFAYRSVWITPVEKSVDNVEKYEFSTVIHRLWREKNLALSVHMRMHNFGYSRGFSGYVARGNWGDFYRFSVKKLAFFPKRAYFAWGFRRVRVKFCTTCTKWRCVWFLPGRR